MTAVCYKCCILRILNNIIIHIVFFVLVCHSVLMNLQFTLSLNGLNHLSNGVSRLVYKCIADIAASGFPYDVLEAALKLPSDYRLGWTSIYIVIT